MSLANGLSILFIFSKNQLLALLIFAMVSLVSFAFMDFFFSYTFFSYVHEFMETLGKLEL